jgi:Ni/Co efflux regulator RcnB
MTRNIVVSTDNRKIFEFLGYDYNRYLQGFDTKEEVFDFIIDGEYFDSKIFQMDELTSIDRKRNKKRATYQDFLQYLENNNINKTFPFEKDKEKYLEHINRFFPECGMAEKMEEFKRIDDENKEIADKFNGKHIMMRHQWLKGKELGDTMKAFKEEVADFRQYVLDTPQEKIMTDFDEWLEEQKPE